MKKTILFFVISLCSLMIFAEKIIDWQGYIVGEDIPKWVMAVITNKSEKEIKKALKLSENYTIWTFKYSGNDLDSLKTEGKFASIPLTENTNNTIIGIEQERTYWIQYESGMYLYIVIMKKKIQNQTNMEKYSS